VATACSGPPAGRARWTLELLADELVRLTVHDSLSRETVRRRLAENELKPWRQDMWCIPHVDGEYVARMEGVLDLYAEAPDPKRPIDLYAALSLAKLYTRTGPRAPSLASALKEGTFRRVLIVRLALAKLRVAPPICRDW
jgi:hypothetical protein